MVESNGRDSSMYVTYNGTLSSVATHVTDMKRISEASYHIAKSSGTG